MLGAPLAQLAQSASGRRVFEAAALQGSKQSREPRVGTELSSLVQRVRELIYAAMASSITGVSANRGGTLSGECGHERRGAAREDGRRAVPREGLRPDRVVFASTAAA